MRCSLFFLVHVLTASFASGSRYGLSLVQLSTSRIEHVATNVSTPSLSDNSSAAESSAPQSVVASSANDSAAESPAPVSVRSEAGNATPQLVEGTIDSANYVHATAHIDGSRETCRDRACSYGILLCEKLLRYGMHMGYNTEVALFNAGGIGASISEGVITEADMQNVHPHNDTIRFFKLPGEAILQQLRKALVQHKGPSQGDDGSWPQVAGLRFNATWHGSRWSLDAVKVKRFHVARHVYAWVDLNETHLYNVVSNSYIVSGKGGHAMIGAKATSVKEDPKLVRSLMVDYFRHNSPVMPPAIDDRETLLDATTMELMKKDQEPTTTTTGGEMMIWEKKDQEPTTTSGGEMMIWQEQGAASRAGAGVLLFVLGLTSRFVLP